jgi:hypothetical protein
MAETTLDNKDYKMAVLIDGDNAQASLLNKMLAEIAKHGSVTIRRSSSATPWARTPPTAP